MIYVDKEEFEKIKKENRIETFVDDFINKVKNNEIEYPFNEPWFDIETCEKAFKRLLHNDKELEKIEEKNVVFTENSYIKYKPSNKCLNKTKSFHNASNYFHVVERYKCSRGGRKSFVHMWYNEPQLLKRLITVHFRNEVDISSRSFSHIVTWDKILPFQFNPFIAKWIYSYFQAENVLDLSAGWGDRLCGFYATPCCKHYTGIDPNPNVQKNYPKQVEFYQNILNQDIDEQYIKDVRLIQDGSENVDYKSLNTEFDLIFTSPPYFNVEVYNTEDKNQCYLKYNNVDSWFENYLIPTLKNSWDVLKHGGHLALNIADNKNLKICDRMNDFISTLENAEFQGTFNMTIAINKAFGSDKDTKQIKAEPIWIWHKK